jgi:tetratricopeptide (TPR) repeat protein
MKVHTWHYKLIFSASLFFCFTISSYCQANNSITGFILDNQRNPLIDISVELSDDNYSLVSRAKTDGSGRYLFLRLRRGRYNLRVFSVGKDYEVQTKSVEIFGISSNGAVNAGSDTIQENFILKLKRQRLNNTQVNNSLLFAQEIPPNAKNLYEQALLNLKANKTDLGISKLEEAIKIFPQFYLALNQLGQEYVIQQKYPEAIVVLTTAVEVNNKSFSSQYSLGYSFYQQKQYKEALISLNKSIEINPTDINSLFFLGLSLKQFGKYGQAVENLKKAAKLSNYERSEIHWQLSLLYTNNLKLYVEAISELEIFLKLNPDFAEADKVRVLIKRLKTQIKN